MPIYGLGAHYAPDDVTEDFLDEGVACVGYSAEDAPAFHFLLHRVEIGDLIFIKSQTPQRGLLVKAIGIVTDAEVREVPDLGSGVEVRWVWRGLEDFGHVEDKYIARNVTIFEEVNPDVQRRIIQLFLQSVKT